ncbi:MAG: transcriptional regulator [Candidatus Aenigmatarchaeota archaeon]|nr:MAG: transcriptional regulator [Candidatus Aenigmarchaeota archaeon]
MISSIPLYWRLQKSRYNLIGSRCKTCGSLYFPPRQLCPRCRSKGQLEDYRFSGKGKIVSWTIIRAAPEGFEDQAPYAVAIIELEEGVKVPGQLVGRPDGIEIGKPVRAVFRRITEDGPAGLIHYGLKWEVVENQDRS